MYEESEEMKLLRVIRDKHYQETKNMNTKQLLDYYKEKLGETSPTITEETKKK